MTGCTQDSLYAKTYSGNSLHLNLLGYICEIRNLGLFFVSQDGCGSHTTNKAQARPKSAHESHVEPNRQKTDARMGGGIKPPGPWETVGGVSPARCPKLSGTPSGKRGGLQKRGFA